MPFHECISQVIERCGHVGVGWSLPWSFQYISSLFVQPDGFAQVASVASVWSAPARLWRAMATSEWGWSLPWSFQCISRLFLNNLMTSSRSPGPPRAWALKPGD